MKERERKSGKRERLYETRRIRRTEKSIKDQDVENINKMNLWKIKRGSKGFLKVSTRVDREDLLGQGELDLSKGETKVDGNSDLGYYGAGFRIIVYTLTFTPVCPRDLRW